MQIPEGYRLFEWIDPFEELVGPMCFKEDPDGCLRFAFEAQPKHANTAGQIHGGMLLTFADFALCLAAIHGLEGERCVTVSLSSEFTAPGQVGDFIESTAEVVRRARSLTFVRGTVTAGDRTLLNYSGIVKRLPRAAGAHRAAAWP
ncbi:MAG: PaaI family thioesterase [Acidobacteria bacterium]|nr:PaaI family thioesterase [Acidobacteriota bacterium]